MILNLQNIHKSYINPGSGIERKILNGIDLNIDPGDSIAIVGPSGCGKSTLLNIMGSITKPDAGKIIFNGEDIDHYDKIQLSYLRNKHIGFVFQQHHLLPQLTMMENVLLPLLEEKNRDLKKQAKRRAEDLLDLVNLIDLSSSYPNQLSVGECQRSAVVRALINEPDILLADEPTGSLDEDAAFNLVDLLLRINKEQNQSLVMVTHALDLAVKMNKGYRLRNGQLAELD